MAPRPTQNSTVHRQSTTSPRFDLHVVKGFFDPNTCREVLNDMRLSPADAALTYGRGDAAVDERIRRARRLSPSAKTEGYVTRRLEEERQNLESYFGVVLTGYEPPQFLCYRVGDFFVAHQDGNTGMIDLDSDRARRVSVSIFLNNQSDEQESGSYGGGSLVFSDWRSGSRQEVVAEAGTLVAFRSETTHEVTPVTHGERYAIVSWYGQYGPQ